MADNLTTTTTVSTIPSGTKISTDEDVTNGHVQRVKLAVSADGSSTHIGADANGIQVQGAAADAAAVTGNPVLIGGDDGTNAVNIAVDSDGAIHISDGNNTITVDGTVTANLSATDNAVLDTIASNTSNLTSAIVQDDAPFTPATGYLMMIGGEFDDAGPDSVDEGDAGNVRITANRSMHTTIRDAAGNERGLNVDANGDIGVTNAGLTELAAAINSSRVDVNIAAQTSDITIADGGNAITIDHTNIDNLHSADFDSGAGTDTTPAIGIAVPASGGAAVIPGDATAGLKVDLGADNDVTLATLPDTASSDLSAINTAVSGTLTVDGSAVTQPVSGTVTANLSATDNAVLDSIDTNTTTTAGWDNAAGDGASISGDVAHDTADAGEPVKVGHKAIAHGTNPTAVAANDRTNWYSNRHGVPWVIGGHPNIVTQHLNVSDADGAQTNAAIVTVGASAKIVVTHITVTADNANTGDVQCRIGFGTATTPANDAAGVVLSHPGIAAGSGVSVGSGAGIVGVGGDNEDLRITCEDPAGGNLDVVVGYYTIES